MSVMVPERSATTNGATTYDYGSDSLDKNGQPIFDVMLEPNKVTAEFMKKDPVFGKPFVPAAIVMPGG